MVGVWQPYGCVDVGGHSLTGQRMAPHTPQESPKVKTKCVRIGSCRLYAPMVPLAPHPCVRWWNTKEITLKLTRLGLHSLKGGSPTGYYRPLRRRGYQRTGSGIPPTQRQWRKRDHGSLKPTPPKIEGHPKVFRPRNNISAQAIYSVVPHHLKISTGLPFLFRSPEPLFLLLGKRKSGFGPSRAGKNQLQDKNIPLSRKRKSSFTRKIHTPSIRWPSRATSAHPFRKPPPRRREYQRTRSGIPPPQRQWRKRDHGSLKRKPPETEGYPKAFYPRDTITAQIQRSVVP